MVQVPGFFYAMTRKLGQWKLSTMSFAKIGTSSIRHINWRMTIGLFFRASVSGSSIRLCSIKMAVNFCLIGLAQLAAGSICPRLQVIYTLLACLRFLLILMSWLNSFTSMYMVLTCTVSSTFGLGMFSRCLH
ncbi:hypothetical protein RHMOL_Rhmol08G0168200 [Rhododendron molle]|uniref:Uncharacterized protein n=1 Tax=Rhododendron molle TaxID=49168 RepID=A0ACC0MPD4_RHOML|nr:hypothetical protein RHMOL_Rhmol08G0168200 [Rhododendron molle]